jgi:excisionase family DNA binding protein
MRKRLLKIDEAALILGVSDKRAYELARLGLLPIVHLGRQVRVDPDVLDRFIQSGGKAFQGGWRKDTAQAT